MLLFIYQTLIITTYKIYVTETANNYIVLVTNKNYI